MNYIYDDTRLYPCVDCDQLFLRAGDGRRCDGCERDRAAALGRTLARMGVTCADLGVPESNVGERNGSR